MILNIRITNSNEEFIKYLLQDSNYHLLYEKRDRNTITRVMNFLNNIDLREPITVLERSFAYVEERETHQSFNFVTNLVIGEPRIYIYNTHPGEMYTASGLQSYGIDFGVRMASYILQDKLNRNGLSTIVEERSVPDFLRRYNLPFSRSYDATRRFVTSTLEEYKNLDLIIDLHRDALARNLSIVTIGEQTYARVMFVVNPKYAPNMDLAKRMDNKIRELYPGLSRGIYTRNTGSFNQDIHPNIILLELGGQHNTVSEVLNTIDALVEVIKEVL